MLSMLESSDVRTAKINIPVLLNPWGIPAWETLQNKPRSVRETAGKERETRYRKHCCTRKGVSWRALFLWL